MRNSLIGPQSKKMSNQQNTLDPTGSIHKKTRGKVWPQKNWFWWRGLSLKFRCHFLIQTSPLNPKKKPQELLPLKSDFWPFCMFYILTKFSLEHGPFLFSKCKPPYQNQLFWGQTFFMGFLSWIRSYLLIGQFLSDPGEGRRQKKNS